MSLSDVTLCHSDTKIKTFSQSWELLRFFWFFGRFPPTWNKYLGVCPSWDIFNGTPLTWRTCFRYFLPKSGFFVKKNRKQGRKSWSFQLLVIQFLRVSTCQDMVNSVFRAHVLNNKIVDLTWKITLKLFFSTDFRLSIRFFFQIQEPKNCQKSVFEC